jgi:hypothetical protein
MALSASTIWEVAATGSDGNAGSDANSGGFNPANVNMATDLAATTATSTSPVVTSASYTFVAGDVNAWVFIQSGTNWNPGWYKIASVVGGAATLSAAIGAAVLYSSGGPSSLSTSAGCATTASPTAGVWTIDYSQTGTCPYSFTDMVIDATTNTKFSSAAKPVGKNFVGNLINVTSGTGFTVQVVEVVSTSGTVATCDKSLGTLSSTGGNGNMGGSLASPGQSGKAAISTNSVFIKSATYSITSASTNISGGCLSWPANSSGNGTAGIVGYGAVRCDFGTKPLLQASGITTATLVLSSTSTNCINISVDGASLTAIKGIATTNTVGIFAYKCKASNCTNFGFDCAACIACEATGCSTSSAAFGGSIHLFCTAHNNSNTGFGSSGNFGGTQKACFCLSTNNTGAASDGFSLGAGSTYVNCTAYGNGRDGFRIASANGNGTVINCIAYGNTSTGFNSNSGCICLLSFCAAGNNSTNIGTTISNQFDFNNITLTASPFTNVAGNDYSLNTTAGGGAACRAAGLMGTFPGLSTTAFQDLGAVQHQDAGGGGGGGGKILSSSIIQGLGVL